MTSVSLPTTPGPTQVMPALVDFGGVLRGPLGGATQLVNRLGGRWSFTVTMPPMEMEDARAWSAALMKARRQGVLWPVPQLDFEIGSPGSPLVNGADQAGASLIVDGLSASYSFEAGQFYSVSTGGRLYLYQIATSGAADGSGNATFASEPLLRTSPSDNDVIEIAAPYIEGILIDAPTWALDVDRIARGFSFTIEEIR